MSKEESQLKAFLPRSAIVKLLGPSIKYNEVLEQIVDHLFNRVGGRSIEGGIHAMCQSLGLIGKNNQVKSEGLKIMYYGIKARLECNA